MLYLKNVRKEDNRIIADYYPEDWNEHGTVSVNINDLDDFEMILSKTDEKEYSAYPYAIEALNGIRSMAEGEREIEDCIIMWH
jgi:hypothetical protein